MNVITFNIFEFFKDDTMIDRPANVIAIKIKLYRNSYNKFQL